MRRPIQKFHIRLLRHVVQVDTLPVRIILIDDKTVDHIRVIDLFIQNSLFPAAIQVCGEEVIVLPLGVVELPLGNLKRLNPCLGDHGIVFRSDWHAHDL